MRTRFSDVRAIAGLAGAYVLAARIGLAFDPVAGFAMLVWPPSGISIAALLLLGSRVWPGVFIGAAVANLLAGAPFGVALGIGFGNTLEALAGTFLLNRTPRFALSLETVPSVLGLSVLAAILATTVSATIGVATLAIGGIVGDGVRIWRAWQAWWIGNMVGVLLVAPIIMVWSAKPLVRLRPRRIETVLLPLAVVAVSLLTFFAEHVRALPTPFHQADLLLAVLIWAAIRFGQRGVVTATLYLAVIAVAATTNGLGPFVVGDLHDRLLSLQTFLAIATATCLLLGATIAERHVAVERARSSRHEAERANNAKSDFLAVMSHELRTPLNAIAGFSQLLRDGIYGPVSEKQAEALEKIDASEKELLARIDSLLTFVNLEKGTLTLQDEHVPVAEAFDAVEPAIAPEIRRKHLVLLRELTPPVAVRADRKGLEQILTSLVSNASKYTEDGGRITLGADRAGERVRIWVRDNGIGIAQDKLGMVFDPFFQAEGGTTRRFSGVGLGLTIARELARKMDGELTIASEPGAGTTASVVLPAA